MSDHDDDTLLETLGEALRATDAVPEAAHRAALDAFDFVDLDAAIASLVDAERLTAVRDTADGPYVFETDDGAVEITVDIDADGVLLGQVAPPEPGRGAIERSDGTRIGLTIADDGTFRGTIGAPSGQLLRVRVTTGAGTVTTAWIRIE